MARSHRPASPLAPLVLAGALLLSGCGGESSGEVVGTADPRASASASVSADSAASSSASSTGYEKATPEHPARNVPGADPAGSGHGGDRRRGEGVPAVLGGVPELPPADR